jgi:hypothetical protein
MTGSELIEKKSTKFLFSQHGYSYYACGYRFYKVYNIGFDLNEAIPVDLREKVSG